ncbi:SUKH-3 domain-containing protein [Nocardia sp. NPDC055321]
MTLRAQAGDVDRWLRDSGWFPTRDVGARATELIQLACADAARQGSPLEVIDPAVRFVHAYGDLELQLPRKSPPGALVLKPTGGYEGDADDFAELSMNLGKKLFPVAYETYESGVWLVDEAGRYFYLHSTGAYFLGETEYEAFEAAFTGRIFADAEDYFV